MTCSCSPDDDQCKPSTKNGHCPAIFLNVGHCIGQKEGKPAAVAIVDQRIRDALNKLK
jgi:hypothetical protein